MWTAKNSKIILKNSFLFYKKQAVLSVSSVIQSPETSSFLPHQAILRIATQFQKLSCLSADCNKWTEKWRGSHHQASHWNPNTQLLWNYHVLLPMQSSVYVICVVMWPLSMCINDTNLDMQWHEHSYTAHVFLWAWMARHTAHVFLWAWMARHIYCSFLVSLNGKAYILLMYSCEPEWQGILLMYSCEPEWHVHWPFRAWLQLLYTCISYIYTTSA